MQKITILSVGKTKEDWLKLALSEYEKRLSKQVQFQYFFYKSTEKLIKEIEKYPKAIFLDPQGQALTSETFSEFLEKQFLDGGSKITFVIGGPEGFHQTITKNRTLLSLSPMTFTHQCVRLLLVEQIYRAFEIQKGTLYHK